MTVSAAVEGARAALWLGALWLAVSLGRPRLGGADRLRDLLVLGAALPFALACCGALSAPALFASALAVAAVRRVRSRAFAPGAAGSHASALGLRLRDALPTLVVLGVAWPALVRPPDQGDTLWYHYPNAAAWVHDGGLWQTTTHYWWYPGGSELFAAGLIAAAGPSAAGLAGAVALLLLGLRIAAWLEAEGVRPWVAGAIGAACVAGSPLAGQAGNLQNDVWLAALFVEALWCGRELARERGARLPMTGAAAAALAGSAALCALVKPYGFVFAFAALALGRAGLRAWIAAFVPLLIWIARDAVLWHAALLPPSETAFGNPWLTTIAGNAVAAPAAFASAFAHAGLGAAVFFALGIAAVAGAAEGRVRVAALLALGVFVFEPFGFRNALPQLAPGDSLRFAAPFFALGAIGAARFARRIPLAAGYGALAIVALEISRVLAQYWFVVAARGVLVALALAAVVLLLPFGSRVRGLASGAFACAAIACCTALSALAPAAFYDARASEGARRSTFYTWAATHPLHAAVTLGIDAAPLEIVSPATRVIDARAHDACGEAQSNDAALVVGLGGPGTRVDAGTLAASDTGATAALRCGAVLYRDDTALVLRP